MQNPKFQPAPPESLAALSKPLSGNSGLPLETIRKQKMEKEAQHKKKQKK